MFVPAGLLAPKLVTNFMFMDASAASTILSRTISSVVDKRIVLSNSQFGECTVSPLGRNCEWATGDIMGDTGANISTRSNFWGRTIIQEQPTW